MEILYQDDSIIALNKPSGLLTIRDGYNPDLPTVKSLLEQEFGRCWIVHRLDKETSGVLLLARNEDAHRSLNLAFQNHQIQKTYHAIVTGVITLDEFTIRQPLKVNGDRKHRTVIDQINGKPANSFISVINSYTSHTLISIIPGTGYTHQIRSHLAYSGYPILGDKLYQKRGSPSTELIFRTALHAFQITFTHPDTNLSISIDANYPDDFKDALSKLV